MPTITFTFSDADRVRIENAWGGAYQSLLGDGSPNPQTKAQFIKDKLVNIVKGHVLDYERNLAYKNVADATLDIT